MVEVLSKVRHEAARLPEGLARSRSIVATSLRSRRLGLSMLLALCASGCVRTPSADLTGFGRAATGLQAEVGNGFAEANRIARVVDVDRFVRSGALGLSERRFPPAISPEVAASWRDALGRLARYGNLLATLTDSGRGAVQTDAFRRLGTELVAGPTAVGLDPGVAAGFAGLSGALVDLRAQARAREILRRADPSVRTLLEGMAAAVGDGDGAGLRGSVTSSWTAALSAQQRAYAAAAAERSEPRQRQIVADYLAGIDRRDVQLAALAGLRSSLLGLADAHTAAAAGSRRPFQEVLADVDERLRRTEETYQAVEKAGEAR